MTVGDGMKKFFDSASNCFSTFAIIFFLAFIITSVGSASMIADNKTRTDEEDKINPQVRSWKLARRYFVAPMYVSLVLAVITWVGYVAVPSQKDALIIITGGAVGNFITSDSSAKQIPAEAMTLLRVKLKEEINKVNLESVVKSNVDSLEGKSKDELIQMIKDKNK